MDRDNVKDFGFLHQEGRTLLPDDQEEHKDVEQSEEPEFETRWKCWKCKRVY